MTLDPASAEGRPVADLLLKMTGVSKSYNGVHALERVDFELRPGEVMALLGENGAGKSTLVKILAGLVRPDSGEIEIGGKSVSLIDSRRSQAAGVAVVQQEYSSVPSMTIAENLLIGRGAAPTLWTRRRLRALAVPLLAEVGLQGLDPLRRVEELSVAEAQLIEVARVLAADARIVVFDEPTAALSDVEISRVLDLVRRLAAQGRSIVYVTHRLREVFQVCDRVTIVRNGTSLPAEAVGDLDVDAVIGRMLGRRLATMYPPRGITSPDAPEHLVVDGLVAEGLAEPVSFSARRGEILGFTGQIGSGVSQLARALAGENPTGGGSVRIDDRPLPLSSGQRSPRIRRAGIRAGVAYCSPDRKRDGMFARLSVQTNLSAAWLDLVSVGGFRRRGAERRAAAATAARVAVDRSRMRTPIGLLSGGNQQKIVLGKWFERRPTVLIVEEPTRGVDVGARAEIYTRLREFADAGAVVLITSSDTGEVFGLADRIATFYRGRMKGPRTSTEYTEESLVHEVMHSLDGHDVAASHAGIRVEEAG